MSAERTLRQVEEFHRVFNCAVADEVRLPFTDALTVADLAQTAAALRHRATGLHTLAADANRRNDTGGALLLVRLQLLTEELGELAQAMYDDDIVGCLDALTDLQYVLDGTYLALGLQDVKIAAFDEVHRSNMSKLDADGRPILSDGGRVVKGPNYTPPDLERVLFEYLTKNKEE